VSETAQAKSTRGRRRGGGRAGRERVQTSAPAYIKRQIPTYEFLSEEGLVKLEEQADWIIQEIGLEFRDDPKALEIWKAAGADVKGTRVRLDKGVAREWCQTAPTEFTQHSRNPAKSVRIGGDNQVFAAVYGPPFVRDLDCDVPVSKRHLDMVYAHMKWGDKPHLGAITEKSRAEDSVDMARILHGADFMEDNCVIMGNVNTNSPLLVDRVVTEAAQVYCGANQGLIVSPRPRRRSPRRWPRR
jgi:trimethylamine--corrinoid protein Co-methyltransferase